ncbi:MAG: DUF2252 domain-containing protein [Microthrixaceae bacterium]
MTEIAYVEAPTDATSTERTALGESVRRQIPREALGEWAAPGDRRDPIEILEEQGATRVPELLPVRYGRMAVTPFTFYRGAPAIMAHDLAAGASTPLRTQLCGDAHLLNFGAYATPERRLIFDLNDFDETLPGPFEWDVKRLCASLLVAARCSGQGEKAGRRAALAAASAYREHLRELATRDVLEVWYERIELTDAMQTFTGIVAPKKLAKMLSKTQHRTSAQVLGKLTEIIDGERRIRHQPPLLLPLDSDEWHGIAEQVLDRYAATLDDDHAMLLRRFELVEIAVKVVGVGSVGTRCLIALLHGRDEDDVLFLQVKQAEESVLARFAGASEYEQQGERVVKGQRLMQAASDLFLGWTVGPLGHHYYVRQLRDMKGSVAVDGLPAEALVRYGELCGRTLGRAHARSADPRAIAGYLGQAARFDEAMQTFAISYADQTELDHALFVQAIADGRIPAASGS